MRSLLRLTVLSCALLFGIPAVALLLAHMGFIALPADAYVSSVVTIPEHTEADPEDETAAYELADSPRMAAARAAIVAANALLPNYERGLNRPWKFHRDLPRRGQDAGASMTVCAGCKSGPRVLFVSATVDRVQHDIADVTLQWSIQYTDGVPDRRRDVNTAHVIEQSGEILMHMRYAAGRWSAVSAQ